MMSPPMMFVSLSTVSCGRASQVGAGAGGGGGDGGTGAGVGDGGGRGEEERKWQLETSARVPEQVNMSTSSACSAARVCAAVLLIKFLRCQGSALMS